MTPVEFERALTLAYPRLRRYARRCLYSSHADAEDLLHEVILAFQRTRLPAFSSRTQDGFEQYLKCAFDRRLWQFFKRQLHHPLSLDQPGPDAQFDPPDTRLDPLEGLVFAEETKNADAFLADITPRLHEALQQLKPRQQYLVSCIQKGVKQYALAQALGVTPGYIWAEYRRALAKLKVLLEGGRSGGRRRGPASGANT